MNSFSKIAFGTLVVAFLVAGCAKKTTPSGAGEGGTTSGSGPEATAGSESPVGGGSSDASLSSLPKAYFEFNSSNIRDADRPGLTSASGLLKKSKSAVTIEGHCDERGSVEYNLALGERRAQSVKSYLVKLGVDGKRLSTISYGEERPADTGHDEAAWAKNRRAELVVNR